MIAAVANHRALLVATIALVAASTLSAQNQRRGSSAAKQAEAAQFMASATALLPDPESDVTLDIVGAADGNRTGLRVRRTIGQSAQRQGGAHFWTVDFRSGTYRVFRLGDPQADAARITAHLQRLGAQVSRDGVLLRLEQVRQRGEARRNRLADRQRLRSARRPLQAAFDGGPQPRRGGPSAGDGEPAVALQQQECSGWGVQSVQAWEPGAFWGATHLTETTADVEFDRFDDTEWNTSAGGGCWANNYTFAFTSWWVNYCSDSSPSQSEQYGWIDYEKHGEYENEDFFFDIYHTGVWQQAAIQYQNSVGFSNAYTHYAWGEFAWLIAGIDDYDAWTSCVN